MEFRFEMSGAESDEDLSSLSAWLDGDRGLPDIDVKDIERTQWDAMGGGVLEAVLAIVATGTSLGQLAVAILAWRQTRAPRSTRRVVFRSDGEEVDPAEVRRVVEAFEGSDGEDTDGDRP